MTVVAHAGHWIEGGIFALPVLIVAGALGVSSIRERRRRKREGEADENAADRKS
jgi:hypothetical protein